MITRASDYLYIAAVIAFTVYGQLILKWRVTRFGALPDDGWAKLRYIIGAVFDPFIMSGLLAGVLASFAWIAAMSKFELSYAYPFMALNFVIVLLLSIWLLGEPLAWSRVLGVGLIVLGTVVVARG